MLTHFMVVIFPQGNTNISREKMDITVVNPIQAALVKRYGKRRRTQCGMSKQRFKNLVF